MASVALTDAFLSIAGTDVSDWVASMTLEEVVDELEDTAMGDTARSRLAGLKDSTWTITFHQDFAASAIASVIDTNFGTVVALVAKHTSAAVSSTNPSYTGNALISKRVPVAGGVGDLAQQSVTWKGAGPIVRAVA